MHATFLAQQHLNFPPIHFSRPAMAASLRKLLPTAGRGFVLGSTCRFLFFWGMRGISLTSLVKEAQEWGNEMVEYLGFMSEVLRKVSVAFFLSLQFVFSNTFVILLLMTVFMPILLCD